MLAGRERRLLFSLLSHTHTLALPLSLSLLSLSLSFFPLRCLHLFQSDPCVLDLPWFIRRNLIFCPYMFSSRNPKGERTRFIFSALGTTQPSRVVLHGGAKQMYRTPASPFSILLGKPKACEMCFLPLCIYQFNGESI